MLYQNKNLSNLQSLINRIKVKSFSIETQYKFLKLYKVIENENKIFQEQYELLVEEYCEKDNNGSLIKNKDGGIKIQSDKTDECLKKIAELNEMKIQFPDIYFSLDELAPLNLTLEELMYLEPFIKY